MPKVIHMLYLLKDRTNYIQIGTNHTSHHFTPPYRKESTIYIFASTCKTFCAHVCL